MVIIQPPLAGSRTGVMGVIEAPVSVSVPLAGTAIVKLVPRLTTTASSIKNWSPPCLIER